MSDQEPFLQRWARRKRAAEHPRAEPPGGEHDALPDPSRPIAESSACAPSDRPASTADTGFDLSSLPPLETIAADTDLTAFLQVGVPRDIRLAALRRAWRLDPAIRDFVGLAENAWDFNAANPALGFGTLDPAEASRIAMRLLAPDLPEPQVSENLPAASERAAPNAASPGCEAEPSRSPAPLASGGEGIPITTEPVGPVGAKTPQDIAPQGQQDDAEPPARRRRHGGATPS